MRPNWRRPILPEVQRHRSTLRSDLLHQVRTSRLAALHLLVLAVVLVLPVVPIRPPEVLRRLEADPNQDLKLLVDRLLVRLEPLVLRSTIDHRHRWKEFPNRLLLLLEAQR